MVAAVLRVGGNLGICEGVQLDNGYGQPQPGDGGVERLALRRAQKGRIKVDEQCAGRDVSGASGGEKRAIDSAGEPDGDGSHALQQVFECIKFILQGGPLFMRWTMIAVYGARTWQRGSVRAGRRDGANAVTDWMLPNCSRALWHNER